MNKLFSFVLCVSMLALVNGCAEQPYNANNSPDQQRANAAKAQGELSREAK